MPAAAEAKPQPVATYKPPEEFQWKRKLAMAGAGVLLLIASFGVGALINSDDTPTDAPEPVAEKPIDDDVVKSGKRANTQLVPVSEPIAQPITSAPMAAAPDANMPNEYQRHDATAVSSVEYQQLAARAQAEKKTQQSMVDPRSLTGPAYAQAPRPRRRTIAPPPVTPAPQQAQQPQQPLGGVEPPQAEAPRATNRTRPVAEYQPLPRIRVNQPHRVRLDLMVGPDGRVRDIHLRDVVPGHTADIIAAVQRWRFKPATDNGQPVSSPVTVEISFRP